MSPAREFANDAQAVTDARHFALDVIAGVSSEIADAVALMVSELTANAVVHTASHFTLTVEQDAEEIRVSVTDDDPGRPTVRTPARTEPSGRGLGIVQALADEWGVTTDGSGTGKTVWFRIAAKPEVERDADEAAEPLASHASAVADVAQPTVRADAGETTATPPSMSAGGAAFRLTTCQPARPIRSCSRAPTSFVAAGRSPVSSPISRVGGWRAK